MHGTHVPTPVMLLAWEAGPQTTLLRAWPGEERAQLGLVEHHPNP